MTVAPGAMERDGEPDELSAADPVEAAREAGLRYVSDTTPGIQRKRAGKHFSYIGRDGKPIRDPQELERFRSLGIPPAWTYPARSYSSISTKRTKRMRSPLMM